MTGRKVSGVAGRERGIGGAPYSRGSIKPVTDLIRYALIVASTKCASVGVNPPRQRRPPKQNPPAADKQ